MSYRLSSKRRQARKNRVLKFIVGIVVLGLGLFIFSQISGPVSQVSGNVIDAGEESRTFFGALLRSEQALIRENQLLKQELDQKRADNIIFNELVARNQELLQILGRDITPDFILAGVVKKPPFSPYDIYTIDAGSENGVSVGNIVQFSDFVALGRVSDVNPTASKVVLYSSATQETVVGINGETYLAEGTGGGTFRIRAPRDAEITIGDVLTLPGYATLSIGVVQDILVSPQDSFADVRATTPVNIQVVDLVRVSEALDIANTEIIDFDNETSEISDSE